MSPAPSQRIQQLEQICASLKQENLLLLTENRTVKNMCTMLVDRIPVLLTDPGTPLSSGPGRRIAPSRTPAPPPVQADYPLISWWNQSDWTQYLKGLSGTSTGAPAGPRGSKRASEGINVALRFVQSADGEMISGFRASEIKSYATQLLNDMGLSGIEPHSWDTGGRDIQQNFYADIYLKFPEMALCSQDWKARHMAIHMYPSWHTNHLKRKAKLENGVSSKRAKKEETPDSGLDDAMYTMPEETPEVPVPVGLDGDDKDAVPTPKVTIKIVNPLDRTPTPELRGEVPVPAVTPTDVPEDPVPLADAVALPAHSAVVSEPPVTLGADEAASSATITPIDTTTATATPAVDAPAATVTPASKGTKMTPTAGSNTARNLCAKAWCTKHPGGLTSQYKMYWDSIKNTDEGKIWAERSAAAIQAKKDAAK
ncbi:hypothetical protein C8F04DRAFT_1391239 [Mycena alexandri]|uniref:Uncharacterized protein n=1 Tax=Mycena alexandri TaxID=1745969 RepID=A0AAD6T821_9AGAR|nr:hypothetical protein C8F04DRAFT_1391239 [Mycena alexandri]